MSEKVKKEMNENALLHEVNLFLYQLDQVRIRKDYGQEFVDWIGSDDIIMAQIIGIPFISKK